MHEYLYIRRRFRLYNLYYIEWWLGIYRALYNCTNSHIMLGKCNYYFFIRFEGLGNWRQLWFILRARQVVVEECKSGRYCRCCGKFRRGCIVDQSLQMQSSGDPARTVIARRGVFFNILKRNHSTWNNPPDICISLRRTHAILFFIIAVYEYLLYT